MPRPKSCTKISTAFSCCTAPTMMREFSGEWWMALERRLVMTHAIFSLSTNSFEIFSGYSTSTKQRKRSASTCVALTA